jgi:hypothetical protein
MSDGVYKTGVAIPGVYQLLVTREGYQSAIVNNVNLFPGVTINRDIQLEPLSSSASDNREVTRPVITPVPFRDYLRVENMDAGCTMELFDINGRKTGHSDGTSINNLGEYPPGLYRLVVSRSGVPIYEKAVLKSE